MRDLSQHRDLQGARWARGVGADRRAGLLGAIIGGLVLMGLAAWWLLATLATPASLADLQLVGARSPTPLNVMVLLDDSGSFQDYDAMRHTALDEVIRWAGDNLRDDDTITAVTFSEGAVVTVPQTPVSRIREGGVALNPTRSEGSTTAIQPALELLADSVEAPAVGTVIAVTDTMVVDADPAATAALLKRANAQTMSAITPDGTGVAPQWQEAFPWQQSLQADPGATDEIALAIAEAIAHATGQELEER